MNKGHLTALEIEGLAENGFDVQEMRKAACAFVQGIRHALVEPRAEFEACRTVAPIRR